MRYVCTKDAAVNPKLSYNFCDSQRKKKITLSRESKNSEVFSCYLCHRCGKTFAAYKNLRAHLATHNLSKLKRINENKAGRHVNSKTALCSEKYLADSAAKVTTTDLKLGKDNNNQRRKRSLQDVISVEDSTCELEAKRNCVHDNILDEKKKQETYLEMLLQKFSSIKIKEIFHYQR